MSYLAFPLICSLLLAQAPQEAARVQFFQASSQAVRRGGSVTLRWSASGADRVRIEPLDQEFPAQGEVTAVVRDRTTYWLHVFNLKGSQSVPLKVDLLPDAPPAPPAAPAVPRVVPAVPGQAWIQFAALADPGNVAKLQQELRRAAGIEVSVSQVAAGAAGADPQRVRLGPFHSAAEARRRLKQIQPRIRSLHLKPFVALDS